MKTQNLVWILLTLNIAGSVGLLIWWFLFPIALPVRDASDNFQHLILDADWTTLNLLGLLSCLLLCLGLPGIFIAHSKYFKISGFVGLLLACTGLVLFTAIQYYETFLWPAAAQIDPELLTAKGALVSGDPNVVWGLLISGIILAAGYVIFGLAALRTGKYPALAIWLMMTGSVIFGNGVIFPIRTAGLLLFAGSTLYLSIRLRTNISNTNY
jgi:hypothetical protein